MKLEPFIRQSPFYVYVVLAIRLHAADFLVEDIIDSRIRRKTVGPFFIHRKVQRVVGIVLIVKPIAVDKLIPQYSTKAVFFMVIIYELECHRISSPVM